MEFLASCNLCPWGVYWSTRDAAQADSVWHVYLEHRETWVQIMKEDREPRATNLPGAFGTKLRDRDPSGN